MRWVTRERPKTDRIACPALIRNFIDHDAEIVYVPPSEVLVYVVREGARSFDADGAEFCHRDGRCTFEVLIESFDIGADPALARLARIVHAADVGEDLYPSLLTIGLGGLDVESDDRVLLERGA